MLVVVILLLLIVFGLAMWVVRLRTIVSQDVLALDALRHTLKEEKEAANGLLEKVTQLEASRASLQAELDSEVLHTKREAQAREQLLQTSLMALENRLQQVSSQLLEQRSQELGRANSEQISKIMAPLQTSLEVMQKSVDTMREQHARGTAQVEKSVENVLREAVEIGHRADNLAQAIRSNHKLQGNMGEIVLSELLQSQGLQPGVHFTLQATLRDAQGKALANADSGSRMIPDVLLHFPDKKDVVIDSKVSLNAFLDYVESIDDTARAEALERHIESVRAHVRELARKEYHKYAHRDHEMLPYVIMFVPQDNALSLALSHAPSLWREAFDKNVFITGGQTLIVALRLIELAWRGQRQRENERQIISQAEELMHRVSLFCERFDEIGARINRLQEAYESADKTLRNGRQSMLVPARRLSQLGVKTSQKLLKMNDESDKMTP